MDIVIYNVIAVVKNLPAL